MSVLVRCDGCGALRWSLLQRPGANASQKCEICGQPLKPERRRPGRRFSSQARERRDLRPPTDRVAPPAGPSAAA
ncbi:MAG TPA: hypothetical protein VF545_12825 [Thermoleophilaceae bacterium]|jgi:hypothetical protein